MLRPLSLHVRLPCHAEVILCLRLIDLHVYINTGRLGLVNVMLCKAMIVLFTFMIDLHAYINTGRLGLALCYVRSRLCYLHKQLTYRFILTQGDWGY